MIKKIKQRLRKLTIFDYILIFILLGGVFVFAYIFFRKPAYVTATVKVSEENITWGPTDTKNWFSRLFYNGMKEMDGVGKVQAEVTDIFSYGTGPSTSAVYLTVKIRAIYNARANQYTFKGKPLLIGYPITLNLDETSFNGVVTNMPGAPNPREPVTLNVEARILNNTANFRETLGVTRSIPDALNIGDTVRDNQGNPIIEITGKTSTDAKRLITTSDGRILVGVNPLLKDATLNLRVHGIKIGEDYYLFDDIPLKVGGPIPINLPFVSIWPEITKITIVE